jgi:DNA-directed RNA polymerase subunit RPC12/RpoP
MTTEEKMFRLAQLFKRRDEIEREIQTILGEDKTAAPKRKISRQVTEPKKAPSKKTVITEEIKSEIAQMRANGLSVRVVAEQLGIGEATVVRYSSKSTPSKDGKKRYYCRECKNVFESTDKFIDVVCPNCDSGRIDYATRAKK